MFSTEFHLGHENRGFKRKMEFMKKKLKDIMAVMILSTISNRTTYFLFLKFGPKLSSLFFKYLVNENP